MTQVITTPDGVEHEFPDGASDDVIKNALKSYSSGSKPASTPMPAAMTYDTTDPNASWGSWALSKLHNAAVGGNQFNRVLQDSATFGGLDKAQSLVPGSPGVDQLRAQTEQSRKDIGPVASGVADIAGYAAGPGGLKVGEGIGNLIGRGIVGRVGGSAAEGALASGLGTAGHGDTDIGDIGKAAGIGGLIGGVTGALPGGAGKRPTTPSPADLGQASQDAFSVLGGRQYNSPGVVKTFENLKANIPQGLEANMSPSLGAKIDDLQRIAAKKGTVSDDTIASFQRALRDAGENKTDQKIIKTFNDTLNQAVGPQAAADIGAANRASNIAQTSSDIEGWAAAPSKAPAAIQSALEKRPNLYKTQPGLFDALSAIGQKSGEPSLIAKLRDHAIRGAVGGGLGYGAGYLMGGNPGQTAVEGAMTGVVAPHVIKAAGSIPIRNSLLAAQHLNATGMKVDPGVYTNPLLQGFGMLARQGGYAAGSSGAF